MKDTFDKVPPVINIGELGDSVELKIKELVSDSTKKEEFENKLTSANTVKELQELEKEVDDFLDEQDKAELEREKNKALKEIDQLINDQLVAEHQVQQQKDRVNNKESIVEDILEAVTEARQIAFNNYKTGTVENVEEDKELSQALKDKYVPLLKAAETGSELDKVLSLLDVEEFVEKAEKALEEALEKAQKEGEFTVHDQSLVEAANDKVETDKANAQTLLDELSKQYAEELTGNEGLKSRVDDLQSRLNKVNKVKVPDVSEEILNEFKNEAKKALKNLASNLTDKERKVYEDIIDKMDAKDDAGNNVDEIIQVAIAEDQYKQIEAENDPAEKEKLKKRAQGALNFVEETSKDGEDHPDYKQDLLKEKKRVQDLLNGETTPTPPTDPTDDTEEQPGSPDPDTDSEQGTGDQTPDEDNGQAGTDPSDENDTPADEPSENPQLKAKKASTNEALGELSNLTEENKGKYKNEIENATDENTVDYILDKAKLDDIKNLITASKKDKDAEGRKEVTVKAQKDAKKTINDIKEKLKKNNLTEEQKANLRKLLQNVEVPRTHHYMPQIGNATKEFLSTGILSGKASHARVGWQADGQDNGNGTVWNKTVNFSSGDDILEVRNGIRENAKINLGKGDDQLIVHGVAPASGKNVFRRASGGAVDGGEGTDTVILKGNSEQYLHGVHIPNFDRVELNGTDGHFQIKLSEMKDQKLGGNKPLIVNGVAGQGNTVDFDHKASNRKYENKPGQTIGAWTAQPKTQTKDGKTYVVWQHKDALASSAHEVWVENTLGVRG